MSLRARLFPCKRKWSLSLESLSENFLLRMRLGYWLSCSIQWRILAFCSSTFNEVFFRFFLEKESLFFEVFVKIRLFWSKTSINQVTRNMQVLKASSITLQFCSYHHYLYAFCIIWKSVENQGSASFRVMNFWFSFVDQRLKGVLLCESETGEV